MDIDIVISILKEIKEFEKKHSGSKTVEDFRIWLNTKAYEKESPTKITKNLKLEVNELENEITKQIILLNRYSKQVVKKALEENPYLANEDFTYLFRMMNYPFLTKTQLIEKNAHEKQTGTEIINRLVRNGLLVENPNKLDKRSVQISITELGETVFYESMKNISIASNILCGQLAVEEKVQLLETLKKLNDFHHHLYLHHKQSNIYELEKLL